MPAGIGGRQVKWVLTTPDGKEEIYPTDQQAYAARAKKGGKVNAKVK